MNYNINLLSKENQVNRVLKRQKKNKTKVALLFYSDWDSYSQELIGELGNNESPDVEKSVDLFLINSFQMPHSFIIFKTQKVPHLVILDGDNISSIDYLPLVWKELGV